MATTSELSPLPGQLCADSHVDLRLSSARPALSRPGATVDGQDEKLESDLYHAFRTYGYAQLRRVGIRCQNGHVTLSGRVPTYFLKQLAQSLASSRPGVADVENHIEVFCPR